MQLLKVKYFGPNSRGNRIKIINVETNESKTLSRDYSCSSYEQVENFVKDVLKSEVIEKVADYYIVK